MSIMKQDITFTHLYSANNQKEYLDIVFFNQIAKTGLFFDGLDFYYRTNIISIPGKYKEIDYSFRLNNKILKIDTIKQSWDIHFIKLNNGDIFQMYFMADDNQHLAIFTKERDSVIDTPLGINLYDAVLKNLNQAEECELKRG